MAIIPKNRKMSTMILVVVLGLLIGAYLNVFLRALLPEGNVVRRNVALGCEKWLSAHGMKEYMDLVRFEHNLTDGPKPTITDPRRIMEQIRLRPEDRAKVPGFERIPFEKIGLERDVYRPNLPGEAAKPKPAGMTPKRRLSFPIR